MSLRIPVVFLTLALSVLSFYCTGADNPTEPQMQGPNEVWIQNSSFSPRTLNVSAGTRVTWTNRDNTVHTVDSGVPMNPTTEFNLPSLDPNETAGFTFSSTGTFTYFCAIHGETGTISVN